jgi:hypothetical protein
MGSHVVSSSWGGTTPLSTSRPGALRFTLIHLVRGCFLDANSNQPYPQVVTSSKITMGTRFLYLIYTILFTWNICYYLYYQPINDEKALISSCYTCDNTFITFVLQDAIIFSIVPAKFFSDFHFDVNWHCKQSVLPLIHLTYSLRSTLLIDVSIFFYCFSVRK